MFFLAVAYLPLADVMTFYLAGPIYVTALSAILLREHVGWRRWSAVLIGFVGVVIALRPSAATITVPALIALGGSFFFSLLMVVTRSLRNTDNIVLTSGQIVGTLAFGAIVAPFGWAAGESGRARARNWPRRARRLGACRPASTPRRRRPAAPGPTQAGTTAA